MSLRRKQTKPSRQQHLDGEEKKQVNISADLDPKKVASEEESAAGHVPAAEEDLVETTTKLEQSAEITEPGNQEVVAAVTTVPQPAAEIASFPTKSMADTEDQCCPTMEAEDGAAAATAAAPMDEANSAIEADADSADEDGNFDFSEGPDEARKALVEDQREESKSKIPESEDLPVDLEKETLTQALLNLMVDFHWPEGSSITIERVESTKAAVAELTAAAVHSSLAEVNNSSSIQDIGFIQNTIVTLQQQQIIQLQLVQQLLAQIAMCVNEVECMRRSESPEPGSPVRHSSPAVPASRRSNNKDRHLNRHLERSSSSDFKSPERETNKFQPPPAPKSATVTKVSECKDSVLDELEKTTASVNSGSNNPSETLSVKFASILNCSNQDPNRPLSPGLASFSGFNSSAAPEPSALEGLNNLEMLQRRAQEVLDSASQGLMASSMVDDQFKKDGGGDKREPFFKHRCRYCGKVFGSDSALQIHIRSHTGERPFKCNVCGSRFTTKGNLKVHFQRHAQKFPHVKMNPNPIPEHLDHFHPPILASGERSPDLVPSMAFGPMPPFQPINFLRFGDDPAAAAAAAAAAAKYGIPLPHPPPSALLHHRRTPEPEDLSSAKNLKRSGSKNSVNKSDVEDDDDEDVDEDDDEDIRMRLKRKEQQLNKDNDEDDDEESHRELRQKSRARPNYMEFDDDDDFDEKEDKEDDEEVSGIRLAENLSSKAFPLMYSLPLQTRTMMRDRAKSPASSIDSMSSSGRLPGGGALSQQMSHFGDPLELAKDPRSIAALLPRPGSASSAWESLIEVNTSSETSKLQQLVDNIDNQTSDPNECVVCHRVLSCKSALQMHYRTHTGERPFKCRLCGRAFTTKGNLKTHMGVHRIKEGDMHHQCPVCHKRFTTQLVLQQHIRLHTGEPTDLTLDQIRAGEIRDLIPNFPPGMHPSLAFLHHHQTSSASSSKAESRDPTPGPETKSSEGRPPPTTSSTTPAVPEDLSKKPSSNTTTLPAVSSASRASMQSPVTTDSELSSSEWARHSESDFGTPPRSSSTGQGPSGGSSSTPFLPLDLTPKNSMFSPFLPGLNSLMGNSALNSLANSVLTNTPGFSPGLHPMAAMAGRVHQENNFLWNSAAGLGPGRGNTTCNLCFKTFACNSALEIHYRSHTKERPFKCTICDRGFSTKGNMKQHMLTHKIRDMPAGYDPSKYSSNENSMSDSLSQSNDVSPAKEFCESMSSKGETCERRSPSPLTPSFEVPLEAVKRAAAVEPKVEDEKPVVVAPPPPPPPPPQPPRRIEEEPMHSSSSSSSGGSKHICSHCHKGFSSSSALHIHLRTHTGDKPFKCSVCQKAFTTKGNLKVHMGTHMWTSGASRRGRRMSLELPLGLQFQPPPGDRNFQFPFVPPNFPGGPVGLAGGKFDYSMFRHPIPMPPGGALGFGPPGGRNPFLMEHASRSMSPSRREKREEEEPLSPKSNDEDGDDDMTGGASEPIDEEEGEEGKEQVPEEDD